MMNHNFVIFGLAGADQLTDRICQILQLPRSKFLITNFADGEVFCKSLTSVRNKKVILIQSLAYPVNESLMTLLVAIDALKRASAREINLIIPYYAYARQDRKSLGREPITAKLVADLLSTAGATRMTVLDIHSEQIQGFFNFPVDTLNCYHPLILKVIEKEGLTDLCIVSPDYGGVKRARLISELMGVPLAIIDKRRPQHNQVIIENILGDVANKNCVLVDDLIDTGNTLYQGAKLLKKRGAKHVSALATHGLFSGQASQILTAAYHEQVIENLYISDSLPNVSNTLIPSLQIVSVDQLLAEVIKIYLNDQGSISNIFQS